MGEGLDMLSERERAALRLLLGGHDAKSIARDLDISVHTVNERLREARRKLGVTSSREAARLLGQAEAHAPKLLAPMHFGGANARLGSDSGSHSGKGRIAGNWLAWLGGGMLIMSLIIAAFMLSASLQGSQNAQSPFPQATPVPPGETQAVLVDAARNWVVITDRMDWQASWNRSGAMFRSKVTAAQWASMGEPVRRPLGTVVSRVLKSVGQTGTLPNMPAGEYAIVAFGTRFADFNLDTVETVVLTHEGAEWRVNGYWIRPAGSP